MEMLLWECCYGNVAMGVLLWRRINSAQCKGGSYQYTAKLAKARFKYPCFLVWWLTDDCKSRMVLRQDCGSRPRNIIQLSVFL